MCSYNAPSMLFPPLELLYLAAIAREWHDKNVVLLDAIAENLSLNTTLKKINEINPDLIVTITGFEIFESDVDTINKINENNPNSYICVLGYYPTLFPELTFKDCSIDFILEGEPDINFSNLLDFVDGKIKKYELFGVFYLDESSNLVVRKGAGRIKKPDILPFPAHDLVNTDKYFEPFMPQPFMIIQTARGCPFSCNFCVRTYGQKLSLRSVENIIEEIIWLKKIQNIRSFRIMDDTFTATPKRLLEFCQIMIQMNINISWTCLSRSDTLNEEMIDLMNKSGCKRIYIGFESGSSKILKEINKNVDLQLAKENVKLLKKYKIEVSGFFMVGHPKETQKDFIDTINFAIEVDLDYAMAFEFVCYPGTQAFDQYKDQISFSLLPHKNEFKNNEISKIARKRVKVFYRKFYFRPKYIIHRFLNLYKNPKELFYNLIKISLFQLRGSKKSRNDFI
jgi:radical SAM superfamily enzyme YgiQ (UPF0313 family)